MGETPDDITANLTTRADNSEHAAAGQTTKTIETRFLLLFSALYHDMCETYLSRFHRELTASNLILGSGAAVSIGLDHPLVAQFMAIAVAIIGSVQLVWDFGKTARDHAALRQKYFELSADFQRGTTESEVLAQINLLCSTEPPIIERIRKICHNRAGQSLYGDDFVRA